jgi:ABC-type glutathione transport system ATPase component
LVGPSGSGKSTIARRAFAAELYTGADWPADRAVVDCFEGLPVRQVVALFTAVGFGSPPSWIKPYHVLSGGERFRCDLARALAVSVGRKA